MVSASRIVHGTDGEAPTRRLLRAGALTVLEDSGALRYIRVGKEEVIRGIYVAVRDKNWETIVPKFLEYDCHGDVSSFFLRYRGEHRSPEVDFESEVIFEGDGTGQIRATLRGVANQDMQTNRVGFCVLYPASIHGQPIAVKTPGRTVTGTFPDRISPHQPFTNIMSIHYQPKVPDMTIEVVFSGDVFEMEDQRNWTDASYKVYSTPLDRPRPLFLSRGQSIEQTVEVRVVGRLPVGSAVPSPRDVPIRVELGASRFRLPDIGLVWNCRKPGKAVVDSIDAIRPGHFYLEGTPTEVKRVLESQQQGKAMHAALDVGLILDESCAGLDSLLQEIADGGWLVARIRIFPDDGYVTTRSLTERTRKMLDRYGIHGMVGGGSRAYFAHLNRATLPLDILEFVTFPITPQVHAFDTLSVMETLEVQTTVVTDARELGEGRPVVVGPVTLRPRFNPEAVNPTPSEVVGDPRQQALVAASWLVGSLASMASSGAASATYFDALGDAGVMSPDAAVKFPVYYILQAIGTMGSNDTVDVVETAVSAPSAVAALALENGAVRRVLIANLTDRPQQVTLDSSVGATIRVLDERTYVRTPNGGEWVADRTPLQAGVIELSAYAVAQIDWV